MGDGDPTLEEPLSYTGRTPGIRYRPGPCTRRTGFHGLPLIHGLICPPVRSISLRPPPPYPPVRSNTPRTPPPGPLHPATSTRPPLPYPLHPVTSTRPPPSCPLHPTTSTRPPLPCHPQWNRTVPWSRPSTTTAADVGPDPDGVRTDYHSRCVTDPSLRPPGPY